MDAADEIEHDFTPYFHVYKDGRVKRFKETDIVPASIDPATGVSSKDVEFLPEFNVSARLYLPKVDDSRRKLPILVYYHGGGFCFASAVCGLYHSYLNCLAQAANAVVVTVEYRLAPEHPLPAGFDDSWAALQWVASHAADEPADPVPGPEPWLRDHGDFDRITVAGDSAGGTIVHDMAMRAGKAKLHYVVKIRGAIVVHPFFVESVPAQNVSEDPSKLSKGHRFWKFACPTTTGFDDPRINPMAPTAPSLSGVGCSRVLVCVAEKDGLRNLGWVYYEALKGSGWKGEAEIWESEGEDHVFHLFNPSCENARNLMNRFVEFLN